MLEALIAGLDDLDRVQQQQASLAVVSRARQRAVMRAFVQAIGGQQQAATWLGCSPSYVSKVCHGHKRINGKIALRLRFYATASE